jgi:hypothetical protein
MKIVRNKIKIIRMDWWGLNFKEVFFFTGRTSFGFLLNLKRPQQIKIKRENIVSIEMLFIWKPTWLKNIMRKL